MTDDEVQLNAQLRMQEFDNALESTDANFVEPGQKALAALDEFIEHWSQRLASPESGPQPSFTPGEETAADESRKYAARQLDWAQTQKEKVLSLLSGVRDSK